MGGKTRNIASRVFYQQCCKTSFFFFTVALSRKLKEDLLFKTPLVSGNGTGNPGSMIVPQYCSSNITVFVWGKNTILKFAGNTK